MRYWIAFSLLVLEIMLLPMITAQTVSQLLAGITFTPAEIIGPIAGFVLLGLCALWVLVILLRQMTDEMVKCLSAKLAETTSESSSNKLVVT